MIAFILSLIFLFALSPNTALYCENQFHNINLDRGLSQVSACTIATDSFGRVWIGTRNGLDCWDGERMKSYTYAQRDNSTIIDPVILSIVIDEDTLWALSKSGLSKMDLNTQQIRRYYIGECSDIAVCDGNLFISKGKSIFKYSKSRDAIELFIPDFIGKHDILSLCATKDSSLLIGCRNGEAYEWNGHEYKLLYELDKRIHSIKTIFRDSFSRIWIGCEDGLFRCDQDGIHSFDSILSDVRDIVEDSNNNIWIATFNGVYRIGANGEITHFATDENDKFSIPNNSAYDLMIDADNTLWVGTYFGGVSYKHLDHNEFKLLQRGENYGLTSNIVGHIIEDDNENLWVATEGGGLNYFDRSTDKFTTLMMGAELPQSCNIRYLHKVDDDRILMSTRYYGLKMFNHTTGKIQSLMPEAMYPEHIAKIDSLYAISTIGNGLHILDIENGESKPFPEDSSYREKIGNDIMPILYNQGVLWIGTLTKGLFAYNIKQNTLKQYTYNEADNTSLSSGLVYILTTDSSNNLWVATEGGGVSRYNSKEDNFINYNTSNSELPSNIIHGIIESRFGNLWISTGKGLVRFDVPNNVFYTYSAEGGFPLLELNYNSLHVTDDGVLFAGGIDGLTYFNESILINQPVYNKPILSDLYLNNNKFSVAEYPDVSETDIVITERIKLRHRYREFCITFSTCNYSALKNKYQYMLEGADNDWINAEYKAEAIYANLPAGNYRFKVRATDTSHMIHSDERLLEVIILPPLYLAWYSILLYIATIIVIIYVVTKFYVKNKLLVEKVSMAKTEKENAEESSAAKTRFFTSISNELLTPLTIVISSIDEMFSSQFIPVEIKRRLTSVYNNSIRIKRIASDIVNVKEFESSSKLDLEFRETNIVTYVEVIYTLFVGYAKFSKVKLTFEKESENLFAWIDTWQMERALYNIISLSIRNCKSGGEILIVVKYDKDGIIIDIHRNGVAPDDAKARCSDEVALDLVCNIIENHGGKFTYDISSDSYSIYLTKGCDHISAENRIESNKQEDYVPHVDGYAISNFDEEVINISEYSAGDHAKNLLIVVSDINMKEMLVHSFKKLYNMQFVNSTSQALKQAAIKQPDIILVTYSRGNVSAVELCAKLKRNNVLSSIPVIALASTIDEEDKLNSLKAGAVDYITKPFNLIHLKLKIENLLYVGDSDNVYSHLIVRDGFSNYDKAFIDKALSIIDTHIADFDFSVDIFAAEMKMNRNVFYHKFKQIAQKTPNEMILEVRLKRASTMLLEHPEMTVSEIGYAIGFNSSTYFTQCFKHHFGVSPSKYCKQ